MPEQPRFVDEAGSTRRTDDATIIAGIDTRKAKLDVALRPGGETVQVDNTRAGHRDLLAFLTQHRVSTVGIEASGGYERTVLAALCAAGLHVVPLQPRQVRAFAQYKLRRAKNDRLDAGLIAECVAGLTARRAGFDPQLDLSGEALRRIEQIEADIVRAKTRRESFHDVRLRKAQTREIERLQRLLKAEMKRLVAEVDAAPALAA
ncbi:IS110 family transposase [Methylobacterium sp. CM6247]